MKFLRPLLIGGLVLAGTVKACSEPVVVLDSWWSGDYAKNGCEADKAFMKENKSLINQIGCEQVTACSDVMPRYLACVTGNDPKAIARSLALNDLLRAARRRWKRPFAGKIDVAEKLFLPDLTTEMWAVLKAGNDLRNAVAHGHKEGTIIQGIADVRKALLAWASPPQRPGIEAMTDPQLISTAFFQTASHIVVATMKLEEKNKKKA